MSDPQLSAQPADPIHTKLMEVDSELAAQEAELIAQLETVQEKRKGLKTVMKLFAPPDPPATETASKPELVAEVPTTPPLEALPSTSTTETQATPVPQFQSPSKTPHPAKRQRKTQPAKKTKTTKQSSSWQPYIRAEFDQTSLATLVIKILQREPIDFFGIPTMMHVIFEDDMPKGVWKQARNRISNILAEGVRKKRWYRDQAGQYSLSPAAMESSLL